MREILVIIAIIAVLGGCQTSKVLSFQPQVWKSEGFSVSVTRPGWASSLETTRVANAHCSQFDRVASLTKLANSLQLPNRDEFVCIVQTVAE